MATKKITDALGSRSSLMDRIKNTTKIKEASVLATSKFFEEGDPISTSVPAVNLALSGSFAGGFESGLVVWAGPSKHFKTCFTLMMMKAYLDKYEDAVAIFYDSEFGSPQSYFDSFGIDTSRVMHIPVTNIEELKFDIVKQLEELKRGDHVFLALDSAGNIASKKEVEDALEGKSTADMTRAKQLKSLFRMITPHLKIKRLPMVVVNHTYQTQELYSKSVVSGGTGIYYSADIIFIVGRQQEKDGTEVTGFNFIINVEKSRFVREKSKIPVQVLHNSGVSKWSGLLDIAMELGWVMKPKNKHFSRIDADGVVEDRAWHEDETACSAFWNPILNAPAFIAKVSEAYKVNSGEIMTNEDIDAELAEIGDDE